MDLILKKDIEAGASGLFCHILALLLFLKHYNHTKEKILALSCTEQLQNWQYRSKKGFIPMVPLNKIKPNSANMKKRDAKTVISPANPNQNYFKRDVPLIVKKLKEQLKKEKTMEEHVYSVLMKSKYGSKTSVGQHLHYNYKELHLLYQTTFIVIPHYLIKV